jgi:hypothetical protein
MRESIEDDVYFIEEIALDGLEFSKIYHKVFDIAEMRDEVE